MAKFDLRSLLKNQKCAEFGDVQLVNDDNYLWLPDNSIDLILTDPPFNIARDTNFHTYEGNTINSYRFDKDKGWDSHTPDAFRALLGRWAIEFQRVLRPGGTFAVFCADEYLSDLIGALKDSGLKPRRTITWRKPNAVPINRQHMMMSACEYIVMGVKGSKSVFNSDIEITKEPKLTNLEIVALADKAGAVLELELRKVLSELSSRPSVDQIEAIIASAVASQNKNLAARAINIYNDEETAAELCVPNYVTFNSRAGSRIHPTEKPVPLLRYLIELFSSPNELLLDPFAGSASLGEAAILSGRKAILVEQDLEFFTKGADRLRGLIKKDDETLFG